MNRHKRNITNAVAILIIAAVAFLATRSYQTAPKTGSSSEQLSDLPRLSTMKIVEARVDDERVQVAIEIVARDEPAIVADFVTLYQWGRTKFGPIKCGKEYPVELCQIGEVHIFILTLEEDVPSPTGKPVEVYLTKLEIWLDQIQIDVNLDPTIRSFAEIDKLHASVAQQTQGTGGGAEIKNEIFTGLK